MLFHLDAPEIWAGDRIVLHDVRVNIGREERVRITGDNGAGKTTLLSALLEAKGAAWRDERVLYLPQELVPARIDELVRDLDLPTIERLEVALEGYPGCIVLVTHDDAFAAAVTTRTLRVEGGIVT